MQSASVSIGVSLIDQWIDELTSQKTKRAWQVFMRRLWNDRVRAKPIRLAPPKVLSRIGELKIHVKASLVELMLL